MRSKTKWSALALFGVLAYLPGPPAAAQPVADVSAAAAARPPTIMPAADAIFAAFETHPLVGLGEMHGVAQLLDFYRTLVRDPRFARQVGHVVVEFGGAAHQNVIDRYVNGESVPYSELRKVWTETVGWNPTVSSEGYARFFAQVRQVNLSLSPEQRIKVWLGEPPIDWTQVRTREDLLSLVAIRDSHAAEVVIENILRPNRKALIIYGAAHFDRTEAWENAARAELAAADPTGPWNGDDLTLRDIVEKDHPNSLFVLQTYIGFRNADCTRRFEQGMVDWPRPAIAVAVRGTTLEQRIRECLAPASPRFPPSIPEDVQERVRAIVAANADRNRPILTDSVLFLGPVEDLTYAPLFSELIYDEEWRAELNRRAELMTGQPMPADWGLGFPISPVAYDQRL